MHIRDFMKDDYPAIVDIHNKLNIAWPERPRTPEVGQKLNKTEILSASFSAGWQSKMEAWSALDPMGKIYLNITHSNSI